MSLTETVPVMDWNIYCGLLCGYRSDSDVGFLHVILVIQTFSGLPKSQQQMAVRKNARILGRPPLFSQPV